MRFVVSGASMEPAYKAHDNLVVSKLAYIFKNPQIGDVVVLSDPRTGRHILKRISEIHGKEIFVMGDNLLKSTDSREFGPVIKSLIIGKVIHKT